MQSVSRAAWRILAALAVAVLVALGIAVVQPATAAHAETPNVTPSCASLSVKPNGFAAKGEIRIVVDGEVQTDGDEDGWTVFKGSFSGLYTFEPVVEHDYRVEINSYATASDGTAFSPGTGADVSFVGTTAPCAPVSIDAGTSNCVSEKQAAKQSIDLTFTGLRKSVTYLAEVFADGSRVTHFQFRTAPEVHKTFSGLQAGTRYDIRLTDQSNDVLSAGTSVTIPGCAAVVSLESDVQQCTAENRGAWIVATVTDLVPGRTYRLDLVPSGSFEGSVAMLDGNEGSYTVQYGPVSAGDYRLTLEDDAAPRVVWNGPLTVEDCPVDVDPVDGGPGSGGDGEGSGGSGGSKPTLPKPIVTPGATGSGVVPAIDGSPVPTDVQAGVVPVEKDLAGLKYGTGPGEGDDPSVGEPRTGTAATGGDLEALADPAVEAQPAAQFPGAWVAALAALVLALGTGAVVLWRKRRSKPGAS
jgi:hypothetical protein